MSSELFGKIINENESYDASITIAPQENMKESTQLYHSYVTAYSVCMKKLIGQDIIPAQHEVFRLGRIEKVRETLPDGDHKQAMIKYFQNYQFMIPTLTQKDFDNSECPIVKKMNLWVEEFVVDVCEFILKDFKINLQVTDGKLNINAKVQKIKDFCLTYIEGEKDGKYDPMSDYIHEYIHKHEGICAAQFRDNHERLSALFKHKDVVEEKVVPKSKSQLKKEKAREANKRREQEKKEKQKRQEKEAKYLEQKRKEAEKKRIAVCRAKRK